MPGSLRFNGRSAPRTAQSGFWLANLAYDAIRRAGGESRTGVARIARVAIIGLVIAMGLCAIGIADDAVPEILL